MDLARVRHFVAVAETLNFTTAARHLYMEQPALSRQIKLLEASLGVILFERSSRHVALTEAGEALLPFARSALDACEAGADAARQALGLSAGNIRLGATPQSMAALVAPFLVQWRVDHPGVHLDLIEAGSLALLGHLDAAVLDVAIVTEPIGSSLRYVPVRSSRLEVVMRADDPMSVGKSVDIGDLAARPVIALNDGFASRHLLTTTAAHRRIDLDVRYSSSNAETVVALVAAGLGVGVLPDTVGMRWHDIVSLPIVDEGEPISFNIVLAWDGRRAAARRYEEFASALTSYWQADSGCLCVADDGTSDNTSPAANSDFDTAPQ